MKKTYFFIDEFHSFHLIFFFFNSIPANHSTGVKTVAFYIFQIIYPNELQSSKLTWWDRINKLRPQSLKLLWKYDGFVDKKNNI